MHTPTTRNVTILMALVTAALVCGCDSKSDAAAQKSEAPKAGAAKPAAPATPAPAAAAKPGLPVRAEPVKVAVVTDDVSAVGSLLAEESVVIRPEIDGRIVGLHFQ